MQRTGYPTSPDLLGVMPAADLGVSRSKTEKAQYHSELGLPEKGKTIALQLVSAAQSW
jgi:hypothetical protein